ncbi:MAG: hypothetical protein JWO86_6316 [Myxococcaceae bacterium]|nr:hypothetical protein [Myxococcaceae bacterium]
MALSGPQRPQLVYARGDELQADTLAKALELARKVEELLEDTRSIEARVSTGSVEDARAHSARMARAMAASLVDELNALVRPARRTDAS